MRRRTILVTLGSVLSAGCSQLPVGPETTSGGRQTDTPAGTPTDTRAGTQLAETLTDTPTETDTPTLSEPEPTVRTETETPTETDTPTETEEPVRPTPERIAGDKLERARTLLADAVAAYAGFAEGDGTTILDVNAATAITPSDVTNPVGEARGVLDSLPDLATREQERTARTLRTVATFVAEAIACQSDLHDTYSDAVFIVDRLYAEQTGGIPSTNSQLRNRHDLASGHLATIREETSEGDMAAFDGISGSTYTDKVAQFEEELATLDTLSRSFADYRQGIATFEEAVDTYEGRDYFDARDLFPEAVDHLDAAREVLSEGDPAPVLAETFANLREVARVLARGSEDMADAAEAGYFGNNGDREDAFERAEEHFESSEFVLERIDSVDDLLD